MRRLYFFFCGLLMIGLPFASQGQDKVPYTIRVNDPTLVPSTYVDLVYFDYEGGLSSPDNWNQNTKGLGSSIQAEIKPLDKVGIQGKLTFYWYDDKTEFVKAPFHLEGGGVISLRSKVKKQSIKVPLRYFRTRVDVVDSRGTWQGTTDGIGMNYIEVEANKEFRTWGRAGLLTRRASYRSGQRNRGGSQMVAGLYAGFEITRKAHVVTQLADREAVSAEYIKFYGDLMVFPLAVPSTMARGKRTPLGFRLGMTGKLPGMRHFFNYMFPKVEIGMLPLDGLYWSIGLGWNVFKA